MELIVFVAALCILAVLAQRFGHDSRIPTDSKEYALADFGLSSELQSNIMPLEMQEYVTRSHVEVSKQSA